MGVEEVWLMARFGWDGATVNKLLRRIGDYVSHVVVAEGARSEAELNAMNRVDLARAFIALERTPLLALLGQIPDGEEFLDFVARDIDLRIPKAFVKWRDRMHDNHPPTDTIRHTGLDYHYQENYERAKQKDEAKARAIENNCPWPHKWSERN